MENNTLVPKASGVEPGCVALEEKPHYSVVTLTGNGCARVRMCVGMFECAWMGVCVAVSYVISDITGQLSPFLPQVNEGSFAF